MIANMTAHYLFPNRQRDFPALFSKISSYHERANITESSEIVFSQTFPNAKCPLLGIRKIFVTQKYSLIQYS